MLVSNIRCKNLLKSLSLRTFFTRILKREGWEINDLSPLSWQLFWDFMTFWAVFKGLRVFETDFCFKKTQVSQLWYHEMFVFSEFCLSQKTFYCRNLIVFSCLQFADCYIWSRILSCGVILFNHSYEIFFFEKFSLKRHYHDFYKCLGSKSWCCRKHVFVFEIVSLKGLNKFLIKLSFSLWLFG
jgi:hypothetical protein